MGSLPNSGMEVGSIPANAVRFRGLTGFLSAQEIAMLSDEELSQMSCKHDWEQCPCIPCKARREIVWLRGEVKELRDDQDRVIRIRAILREQP